MVTLIVAAAAGWRYLYDLGSRRIGMVDAIASDISSIGRVFLSANIINSFVELTQVSGRQFPMSGKEDTEDYFDLYRIYLRDIGALESESVRHVTACYTFLKASRDMTIPLKKWKGCLDLTNESETLIIKAMVTHVVYQCLFFAANAQSALLNLRDDDDIGRRAAAGLFVVIQVQVILYLMGNMDDRDYRRPWIETRCAAMPKTIQLTKKLILEREPRRPAET